MQKYHDSLIPEATWYRLYLWSKIGLLCLRDNPLKWIAFHIVLSLVEFKHEVRSDQTQRD